MTSVEHNTSKNIALVVRLAIKVGLELNRMTQLAAMVVKPVEVDQQHVRIAATNSPELVSLLAVAAVAVHIHHLPTEVVCEALADVGVEVAGDWVADSQGEDSTIFGPLASVETSSATGGHLGLQAEMGIMLEFNGKNYIKI